MDKHHVNHVLSTISGFLTDLRIGWKSVQLTDVLQILYAGIASGNISLHHLDGLGRLPTTLNLWGCSRKMACSDTHLKRFFETYIGGLEELPYRILEMPEFQSQRSFPRLLILDGTDQSRLKFSVGTLYAGIPVPIDVILQDHQGLEMESSLKVLETMKKHSDYFDIAIGDGYYFGEPFMQALINQGKDVMVKTREQTLTLVQDLESAYAMDKLDHFWDQSRYHKGFDLNRGCRYEIYHLSDQQYRKLTRKLQCYRIEEYFPKQERVETYYVFTTSTRLTLNQVRECSKERWQIEDNVFRLGSQNGKTKLFRFKNPEIARKHLFLFYCLMAVFWALYKTFREKHPKLKHQLTFKLFIIQLSNERIPVFDQDGS